MITTLTDIDISGKTVLIREDLNVPMKDGAIANDARLKAALPTIQYALSHGAAVILMSHLGRPTEGSIDENFSLKPVATALSNELGILIPCVSDWQNKFSIEPGQVVLLENVRFNIGEIANDDALSKQYASLCDVFVMDAFATAHRAQASTEGVARYAKVAVAGPLLMAEVEALTRALEQPVQPMLAIVGGAKVSSKVTVLDSLLDRVNQLIVGGGIANTFIKASGYSIGKSLVENDLLDDAKALIEKAKKRGAEIPIPQDVIVATEFSEDARAVIKDVANIDEDDMILDIGPKTAHHYSKMIQHASTIIWNGPVGVFEIPQFSSGTKAVAEAIAHSNAFSIAGGGDTVSAIHQFGILDDISYLSTGGGAFLSLLEGNLLPGLRSLHTQKESVESPH